MYVSVTYGAGGSTQDRTKKTLQWIKEETDLSVMSHLTCIGATKDSMDSLLKNYAANGIDNVLAMRGDPPKNVKDFDPTKGEFKYAKDLVEFVKKYNSFSIGVAVYPEGHQEAPSLEKDIDYTKLKVDAGADFGITQMFFDNRYYYDFLDRAGKAGINIPILPGILPITDIKKVREFSSFCKTVVPGSLAKLLDPVADNPDEMRKRGLEYTVKQCEDLLKNKVSYLHFFALNRSDAVSDIINSLGGIK
jgi:methylenetetrahydrofolate reductase (NADPH)